MRETEGGSPSLAATTAPSLDVIFDILSNRRRRHVLYYLNDRPDGVATVEELTDVVLTQECDGFDPSTDPVEQRNRIQIDLQHVHLPKLADAGIVDHDRRTETVRYWTQPSLTEWLEHAQHKELQ